MTLHHSPDLRNTLAHLADRHGFSPNGVAAMWAAMVQGQGGMAQFDHPDFGGSGQWMRGGMTMVANLFDGDLRRRVDALCSDLARLLDERPEASQGEDRLPLQGASGAQREGMSLRNWWPRDLHDPASTGSQNGMRYAYFPAQRRLAVDRQGQVTVYDTQEHQISGVSQQQGPAGTLLFSSQHGPVALDRLPVVSPATAEPPRQVLEVRPRTSTPTVAAPTASTFAGDVQPADGGAGGDAPQVHTERSASTSAAPTHLQPHLHAQQQSAPTGAPAAASVDELLGTIDRLSDLCQRGVLTAEEFRAKKAELLARI